MKGICPCFDETMTRVNQQQKISFIPIRESRKWIQQYYIYIDTFILLKAYLVDGEKVKYFKVNIREEVDAATAVGESRSDSGQAKAKHNLPGCLGQRTQFLET